MKLLLLGGTQFLGKHIAEKALEKGFEITLFNRGVTNPDFLQGCPSVRHITGDRTTDDIKKLTDYWDAVIDTSGRDPKDVQRSVEQLKNRCGCYVFISSISAYKDLSNGPIFEHHDLADRAKGDYGGNKVACEYIVNQEINNKLIIRPGLIVGPDDPTDRFTYWPWRMSQSRNVLVPDVGQEKRVQFIDVRDLADWIVMVVENGLTGIYNTVGPEELLGYREFLKLCLKLCGSEQTKLYWVEESLLEKSGVEAWIELPFWLPDSLNGMMDANCDLAIKEGLEFLPMEETIVDTLEWSLHKRVGEWSAGLPKEKELKILEKLQ